MSNNHNTESITTFTLPSKQPQQLEPAQQQQTQVKQQSLVDQKHAINQIDNLVLKKIIGARMKLELIVKAYFQQMTTGCILVDSCPNTFCVNNKDAKKQVSSLSEEEIARDCVKRAREAFDKTNPKYYFCPCPSLVVPDYTPHYNISLQYASFSTVYEMVKEKNDYTSLNEIIKQVFSSSDSLNYSFFTMEALKKKVDYNQSSGIDFESVEKFYHDIQNDKNILGSASSSNEPLSTILIDAIDTLSKTFSKSCKTITEPQQLRQFIILLQFEMLMEPNHHDILSRIMEGILLLPIQSKSILKNMLAEVPKDIFTRFISLFQQFITVQLYARGYIDEKIAYATRVIGLLDSANELKVLHKDRVHYDHFYNDAVNSIVDLKEDYKRWMKSLQDGFNRYNFENFSFCQSPFILDPQSKSQILQLDAEYQQQNELRHAFMSSIFSQTTPSFYLVLNIHRERLLQSALNEITVKHRDLKKQLKVHFVGEEGVDEGGVQKEFFQLVVRQIFDVQYGMFEYNERERTFWFNINSFENEDNFRLIGTVLGLAIYNGVILDIHFPLVVYKKLLGMKPTFEDLKEMDPEMGLGLQRLLEFEGDVEEVFMRSFQVETEAFGKLIQHDLKPNGADIPVTNANRQEYVDLFVEWKLEKSIKKQFDAFYAGFNMVVDNQDILHLFRPEELELMVCGSPSLDFDALERVTKYADGFTKDDPLIKEFWQIVKSLSEDDKKKFLSFCTGSDRVPIKGLGSIQFVIVKNGDDSDRLPTAHTCFNYLLIPRYSSGEKLKERLLTAIQNFHGFGLQ